MRPLLLSFQGIGPFVQKTTIDFTLLDKRSLFLIHGPTGSGKSFLFDAVCYALYAQTPAGRESHLRSDFLDGGDRPFVDFRFIIGDIEYRVHRELSHERPKKRGGGLTTVPEQQELVRYSTSKTETLATKKTDVDGKLREILGLSISQFRQVVMIPQGEFRQLLLSGTDEREKLLERLFDASFYKSLQEEFEKREEEGRDSLLQSRSYGEALKNEALSTLRSLENSLGMDTDGFSDTSQQLTVRRNNLDTPVNRLRDKRDDSLRIVKAASAEVERAGRLNDDYKQLHLLTQSLTEHQAGSSLIDNRREALVWADKAAEIQHLYQERELSLAALNGYRETLERSESALKEIRELVEELDAKILERPGIEERLAELERRLSVFENWRSEAQELHSIQEQLDSAYRRRNTVLKDRDSVSAEHNLCRKRLEELCGEIEVLKSADGKEGERSRRIADTERLLEIRVEYEKILRDEKKASTELVDSETSEQALSLEVSELEELRKQNIAGELASSLSPASPCPVCGSREHPLPAEMKGGFQVENLSRAEKAFRAASLRTAEIRERARALNKLSTEKEHLVQQLSDALGLTERQRAMESMRKFLEDLKSASLREAELQNERDVLVHQKLGELDGRLAEISQISAAATLEIERIEASISERTKRWKKLVEGHFKTGSEQAPEAEKLPELLDSWNDEKKNLKTRLESLDRRYREARDDLSVQRVSVKNNRKNLDAAEAIWKGRCGDFDSALAQQGFADEASFAAARMDKEKRHSERSDIAEYDRVLSETVLRQEDLKRRTAGQEPPDMPRLHERSRNAEIQSRQLNEELALLNSSLERFDKLTEEIAERSQQNGIQENEHALLRKLSRQLRGIDAPRISLNRFFLARRLEEVLIQATRRLSILSNDRFTLKRRDEGRHAAAQAGLDLMIADSWTGTVRPVNSLSGGQLFMAALSLALGLADVVQARSGGVRIEALFIDEGFGTLDEEALQGVLGVLNDLRSDRMVGVISHVDELKRQIASRIEVSPVKRGSTAELIPG